MSVDIEAMPRELYRRLRNAKITDVHLSFEGGCDEAYVDVTLLYEDKEYKADDAADLEHKVEMWIWDTTDYNGAGDGNMFGDDVQINLLTKEVLASSWWTESVRHEGNGHSYDLDVAENAVF